MTGSCLFCRCLRLFVVKQRFKHIPGIRSVPAERCWKGTRSISSCQVMFLRQRGGNEPPDEVVSESSTTSDSSSSESSGSESESEGQDVRGKMKTSPEPDKTQDLLSLLRAGEKKWGDKEGAESNLKNILHSVDTKLVAEARKLSGVLPGDQTKTESALLGQLLHQFDTTAKQKKGEQPKKDIGKKKSLSEIMEGITIEKAKHPSPKKGAAAEKFEHYRDEKEDKKKPLPFREPGIGLFSGKPLGIFMKEDMKNARQEKRSLFEVVEEEQRDQLQFYPPRNAFEEQIQWTLEGKLWTFPIDNEAGWEEEKKVEFHEHVFLENQLSDFPKKGPIRHFMELVTAALSKNPYLTVQQKHEHVDWYRNYFKEKQTILEERLGRDGIIASKQQKQLQ